MPVQSCELCSETEQEHDRDPPFPKPIQSDNLIVFSKLNGSTNTSSILAP